MKDLSSTVFSNVYTFINLMNRAKYQAINIISDKNSMSNF